MMLILTLSVGLANIFVVAVEEIEVSVDTNQTINEVNKAFHGVALDTSLFTSTGLRSDVNLKSEKLVTLLKALSPGYLRVGGTATNWLYFDIPTKSLESLGYIKANILKKQNFDDFVNLTKKTGNRLLFDLNAELRSGKDWNPSDAIRLFEYCKEQNYGDNIDWELGNEPNHVSPSNLTKEQVAEDYVNFHKVLRTYDIFKDSALVGPGVGWMGVDYIRSVADSAGEFLTAYTLHQYYFDGKTATPESYMNKSNFETLKELFDKVKDRLKGSKYADKQWWIGETSGGYNSGTKNVSDRYVSGFLYLDKLGLSAASNVNVVIRQTIFNGDYGLLNLKTLDPFPDYWLMFVHNSLVGQKVFKVKVNSDENEPRSIRVYAQCTKETSPFRNSTYENGSLTIFALNVHPTETRILKFNGGQFSKIHVYVLTPENNDVLANGVSLLEPIKKLQKRFLRNTFSLPPREHTAPFFKASRMLDIYEVNTLCNLVLVFKVLHSPHYQSFNTITTCGASRSLVTRQHGHLELQPSRTRLHSTGWMNHGIRLWNKLEHPTKDQRTSQSFKTCVKNMLLDKY